MGKPVFRCGECPMYERENRGGPKSYGFCSWFKEPMHAGYDSVSRCSLAKSVHLAMCGSATAGRKVVKEHEKGDLRGKVSYNKKDPFKGFPQEACFGGVSPPEALLIPREEWEEARNKEDPGENHPCNSWNINECDCKGACSCHWKATASPGMIRASGDVICEVCGKKYYDHPMDMNQFSYDGHPFLHVRCDGIRLKL